MTNTFYRITNKDIIKRLDSIDEKLNEINKRLDITNGRVTLNRWIATTAFTVIIMAIITILGVKYGI